MIKKILGFTAFQTKLYNLECIFVHPQQSPFVLLHTQVCKYVTTKSWYIVQRIFPFPNQVSVWKFAMIWIFSFHSPFLTDSTKAANKFRLDTYLLEFIKERWQTLPHLGRVFLSKTPFWQWRMICNLSEFHVSNLMLEIIPLGWEASPKLETASILFGEFLSKR